ncbi:MAG: hypothetical protein JO257_17765 [Deltaproteobacteria bacterium]|nr:hypothetical protein [Deltaproteobacteria bacterium]
MEARKTPKFWVAVQPTIIRLYKAAGLVALTAILIGLLGFLIINIFYFFDHTWVRPVVLSPTHQKVVEASNQLNDAKLRQSQLDAEKIEIEASLSEIDRTIAADDKFLKDVGNRVDTPKTPDEWIVHREVEKTTLDRQNQEGRRAPLKARLEGLALRIKDEEKVVDRLAASPYLKAVNGTVVLAFVPYQNLRNVKPGTKLYGCTLGLVMCHVVGKIKTTIDGEVQDIHPHDESVQRGIMVEIDLNTPSAANDNVLFAGGKPLWLF